MKIAPITSVKLLLIIGIFIFVIIQEVKSKGGGRGGGRWGSRGSSGGYRSVSGSSTKSFTSKSSKNWKKAATFGAGAYVGHKVSKKVRIQF